MRSLSASFLTLLLLACSSSSTEGPSPNAGPQDKPVVPDNQEGESEESKEKEKAGDTTVTLGLATEDFWKEGMPLDRARSSRARR